MSTEVPSPWWDGETISLDTSLWFAVRHCPTRRAIERAVRQVKKAEFPDGEELKSVLVRHAVECNLNDLLGRPGFGPRSWDVLNTLKSLFSKAPYQLGDFAKSVPMDKRKEIAEIAVQLCVSEMEKANSFGEVDLREAFEVAVESASVLIEIRDRWVAGGLIYEDET